MADSLRSIYSPKGKCEGRWTWSWQFRRLFASILFHAWHPPHAAGLMDRKGNAVFQIYLVDVKQINHWPTQILLGIILFFFSSWSPFKKFLKRTGKYCLVIILIFLLLGPQLLTGATGARSVLSLAHSACPFSACNLPSWLAFLAVTAYYFSQLASKSFDYVATFDLDSLDTRKI